MVTITEDSKNPKLDHFVESVWLRLVARVGVPAFVTLFLPAAGWLGWNWYDAQQEKTQTQISILNKQLESINTDRQERQKDSAIVVKSLTDTLNDVQRTMVSISATQDAQYKEVSKRVDALDRRQERMEDRINMR